MKTYKAKRKSYIKILLLSLWIVPLTVVLLESKMIIEQPYILRALFGPGAIVWRIYSTTVYMIKDATLIYRSGFLYGQVDIFTIREIRQNKTMWVGLKPALATKGLIIKRSDGVDIYIAPENNNEMIADLLEINPEIMIR